MKNKYGKLAGIAGLIVLIDQVTKAAVLHNLTLYRSIVVIPGFFSITHVQNPGGAFGFLAHGSPELRSALFLVVSLLAMILIFYFYKNTPGNQPLQALAFALIFGGAAGNMIDRIRMGYVVDFLDVYIGNRHWPAFNVADSAITVGVGVFLFATLFKSTKAGEGGEGGA